MDPKEKKVKEEELNVEETLNNAEEQPQDEQAENAVPMTHEEELEKELETAQETIEEQKDKYLRLSAEFDNYRKRTMKEKAELILNGGEKSLAVFFRWWMISNVPSKRWKRLRMSKL
mgnify:CR=1 FL=1